jgi:type II secretory pathway pseudopilin PulG
MSNYNHRLKNTHGFTLVEVLVVIPIVILVIGVFIGMIVSMTGDVLATRSSNVMAFDIQDTLNRIEQDVRSSGSFLATNNISPLSSPQGRYDDTSSFHNIYADTNISPALILNIYATTSNPSSSNIGLVYSYGRPNVCDSLQVNHNSKVMMNVVYFVKDGALWRRTIAPSNYNTMSCVNGSLDLPWQQPSCAPGQTGTMCVTEDIKLVDGVAVDGFVVNYYSDPGSSTPNADAVDASKTDDERFAAMQTTNTISVTINGAKIVAGRDISQSGTVRASSPNNNSLSSNIVCPSGFIMVPGSETYGTGDFCVMQYEAKAADATTPISQASGAPWTSISQIAAAEYSQNVDGCRNDEYMKCHLITEAEWLTIAQNVTGVDSNWSGSSVGSGCIFRGNVGNNDTCGYDGSNPESGTGRNSKASLTLSNGAVIWDFAGNVAEWTSGTVAGNQPGENGSFAWRDWKDLSVQGNMSPNPFPSFSGISGAGTWTGTSNGIGEAYTRSDVSTLYAISRSGRWDIQESAGVYNMSAELTQSDTSSYVGFRVAM